MKLKLTIMKNKKLIKSLKLSKKVVSNFRSTQLEGGRDTNQRSCYYTIYWCETAPPACAS